jgi:O-antigen ligase
MAISSLVYIEPAPYDVALVGLSLALFAAGMRVPRQIHLAVLLLGVFVFGNVLAAALAHDPLQTLRSLGIRSYMVLSWLFFVCLVATDPERILPALWKGYLVAALGAALFGIAEYYDIVASVGRDGGTRARGVFKDANVFGPFLVPAVLYAVHRLRDPASRRRALYAALIPVLVLGILLSFSRGAWINLALSLALLLLFLLGTARPRREKLGTALAGGLVLAAGAAVVIAAVSFTTASERFAERAVLAQRYDLQEGGRFYTQRLSLERAGGSPLGVGPGRTDEEFGLEPHNLYLHVLVEGGWIAGLAFYAVIGLTLALARHALAAEPPLRDEFIVVFSATLGILAQSLFIDSTHWRHLWLLLGLCWGLIVVARRRAPVTVPAHAALARAA